MRPGARRIAASKDGQTGHQGSRYLLTAGWENLNDKGKDRVNL